ncbi:MAG: hydrolase [Anaerotignaceae bacterium]
MVNIRIINGDIAYEPVIVGEVKLSTERFGSPGKLAFEVVKDGSLNFQEGNVVELRVDGEDIFLGYVFEKKRSKGETISVTAYDQLRYLKNKDVRQFENKKASEIIKLIAANFSLDCGDIADTGWVIESLIEDDKTLFDTIQEALYQTLTNTKAMFVLYDDFGKLTLKNVENMRLNILMTDKTAEDFQYWTSIDSETYNQVKLVYENKRRGIRQVSVAKDPSNINNWGLLQCVEKTDSEIGLATKANALLSLYNKKTRKLSLKNAFGDAKVQAGCSINVSLSLGDITVNQYFICEAVTHNFKADMHLMDITLRGADFIV